MGEIVLEEKDYHVDSAILGEFANITSLFKYGSKTYRTNYHQISLISVASKLLKKIVKSHVMEFLTKLNVNILNPNQFIYK